MRVNAKKKKTSQWDGTEAWLSQKRVRTGSCSMILMKCERGKEVQDEVVALWRPHKDHVPSYED
jgi:hypothetical protein